MFVIEVLFFILSSVCLRCRATLRRKSLRVSLLLLPLSPLPTLTPPPPPQEDRGRGKGRPVVMSIFTTFWPQWNRAYTFSSISGVSCNPQIDNPLMLVCVYRTCSEGCSAVVGLANREELVLGFSTLCSKNYLLSYSLMLLNFFHYAFENYLLFHIMHFKNLQKF